MVQTKELGLEERIHFLGYRSDVVECINSFDFLVSSSIYEGLALSVIETFLNSKTIVATDIPGINEIVNGTNGLLIPVKNPNAMAQAIDKLAGEVKFREKLAKKARLDYESKYSYSSFINNYKQFYTKL